MTTFLTHEETLAVLRAGSGVRFGIPVTPYETEPERRVRAKALKQMQVKPKPKPKQLDLFPALPVTRRRRSARRPKRRR